MPVRESVTVTIGVRQPDGSVVPTEMRVLPPNMRVIRQMTEQGLMKDLGSDNPMVSTKACLGIFALLLSRSDPVKGRADWVEENVEPEDMTAVIGAASKLMGLQKKEETSPNVESPSPER